MISFENLICFGVVYIEFIPVPKGSNSAFIINCNITAIIFELNIKHSRGRENVKICQITIVLETNLTESIHLKDCIIEMRINKPNAFKCTNIEKI